ncbi:MAG: CDP-alcohol phosphatidyltransferase family protein [Sphingomonas sp.]|nr:CDP-alcohol phosphatidyltransferase family protein [Sphingomonas sp.]
MLHIVGSCDQQLFGITPAERLRRQLGDSPGSVLVASASAVLSDMAVAWLLENRGTMLTTASGRPMAVAVDAADAEAAARSIAGGAEAWPRSDSATVGVKFVRKLRRCDTLFVRSLDEQPVRVIEKQLFDGVYKGITDLVTKYVWPLPAYIATTACARLHLHPNAVTLVGIVAMVAATVLWAQGELAWGFLFAWLMTFLDTVDGKLARVTATSSRLGNKLDHLTDIIHPPFWWVALASALAARPDAQDSTGLIWNACVIILIGYFIGRVVEGGFKKRFGYNPFLWRPFDSAFRTIVSRRNVILLIMSVGIVVGRPVEAFVATAIWTFVSVVIQVTRFAQALVSSRGGPLPSWLT